MLLHAAPGNLQVAANHKKKLSLRPSAISFPLSVVKNNLLSVQWQKHKGAGAYINDSRQLIADCFSHHDIFQNCLPIQHANDAVAISRIMLRVRYHNDRCSLLI